MGKLSGLYSSSTKKHHRDLTHKPITEVLEAFGWQMTDTSAVGPLVPGFPDAVGGQGGITDMFQFKTGNEPLTTAEAEFHAEWRGRPIVILRSTSETESWARRERHERRRLGDRAALEAVRSRRDTPIVSTRADIAERIDELCADEPKRGG